MTYCREYEAEFKNIKSNIVVKYYFFLWLFLLAEIVRVQAAGERMVRISTVATDLTLQVGTDGRLYQVYLGAHLLNDSDWESLSGKNCFR